MMREGAFIGRQRNTACKCYNIYSDTEKICKCASCLQIYVSFLNSYAMPLSPFRPMDSTTTQDKLKLRVGTADLLDMLLEEDDSLEITLALGADTFMDLTRWKWKRSKDIIRLIEGRMIVFQRIFHSGESVQTNVDESTHSGNNSWITHEDLLERIEVISDEFKDAHPNLKDQIILVKLPFLSSVSSSKVRSCTTEDDLLVFVEEEQLDRRVFEFITENKLYGMNNSQKVEQKNEHFL